MSQANLSVSGTPDSISAEEGRLFVTFGGLRVAVTVDEPLAFGQMTIEALLCGSEWRGKVVKPAAVSGGHEGAAAANVQRLAISAPTITPAPLPPTLAPIPSALPTPDVVAADKPLGELAGRTVQVPAQPTALGAASGLAPASTTTPATQPAARPAGGGFASLVKHASRGAAVTPLRPAAKPPAATSQSPAVTGGFGPPKGGLQVGAQTSSSQASNSRPAASASPARPAFDPAFCSDLDQDIPF